MKTITIMADDRVGLLADISYILGKTKINIETISVDVISGKAIISMTIKEYEKASEVLQNAGFNVSEMNAIIVKLPDEPGQLNKITSMLAKEEVNIQNVHIVSRDNKTTIISLVVDKPKKAVKILEPFLLNKDQYGDSGTGWKI